MISTIVATQKFVATHPIIRTNATELYVYRLRNQKDLDALLEELSALYDEKHCWGFTNTPLRPHTLFFT